jgi:type II secretory pathway pseudopilin PulG
MAALLVAMSVMAILASAAMPVWKQMSRREKEAELIFRGQQYARAIGLFQRKMGPGVNPPNLDVLVQQHFLRKKYKDPITGEDFDPIAASTAASPTPGALPGSGPTAARGQTPSSGPGTPVAGRGFGGIVGVMSKSKETSLRIYNGRTHYNEWQFIFVPQVQAAGAGGAGQRGQRAGGPGQPPGGRGPLGGPGGVGPGGRGGNRGTPPPFVPGRGGPAPPFVPGRGAPPPPPTPGN